ncbi:MAG TPA: PEP-CTERM sorting domain-containing protein [Gemmataceae bacterium]|nr:PEP-CTERM sorting domain-containing protein [Gemmataceae bacterium]
MDRFAPAGFSSPQTAPDGGTGTLLESISGSDFQGAGSFYNTQGRGYDLPAGTKSAFIDLYVPSSWSSLAQTGGRLASFWGVGYDSTNAISAYPIIEFNNASGGFRIWDDVNGVWINVGGFTGYNQWYQIGFSYGPTGVTYLVNGSPVGFEADTTTQSIGSVILQGYNSGNSYNINWDGLTTTPVPEPASIALFGAMAVGGLVYGWRRRVACSKVL